MVRLLCTLMFSAAVLAASLGFKVSATHATWGNLDRAAVTDQLESTLTRSGFVIVSRSKFDVYERVLAYDSTGCELTVAPLAEEGHETKRLEELVTLGRYSFFVFDGQISATFPRVSALTTKFRDRLLRGLGMSHSLHPVLGGVASTDCDLTVVDWNSLRELPWIPLK